MRWNGGFHRVADPLRHFADGLGSLFNPVGSPLDKALVGLFRLKSLLKTPDAIFQSPETTTYARLKVRHVLALSDHMSLRSTHVSRLCEVTCERNSQPLQLDGHLCSAARITQHAQAVLQDHPSHNRPPSPYLTSCRPFLGPGALRLMCHTHVCIPEVHCSMLDRVTVSAPLCWQLSHH